MGCTQGAPRPVKHRHVNSRPSSSRTSSSVSLSAAGIHARKTKDAVVRNSEYAGELFSFLINFQILFYIPTAMTPEQRRMVMDLRDPPSADEGDWEMLDDVLRGDEALSISHEGGELDALTKLHAEISETYVP